MQTVDSHIYCHVHLKDPAHRKSSPRSETYIKHGKILLTVSQKKEMTVSKFKESCNFLAANSNFSLRKTAYVLWTFLELASPGEMCFSKLSCVFSIVIPTVVKFFCAKLKVQKWNAYSASEDLIIKQNVESDIS